MMRIAKQYGLDINKVEKGKGGMFYIDENGDKVKIKPDDITEDIDGKEYWDEQLNSCPQCNGAAEVIGHYIKGVANRYHYFVRCKECKFRKHNEYKKRDKAIVAWNNIK